MIIQMVTDIQILMSSSLYVNSPLVRFIYYTVQYVHFWGARLNLELSSLQEKRRKEEETEVQMNIKLAQEAAHGKMARDLSIEVTKTEYLLIRKVFIEKKD